MKRLVPFALLCAFGVALPARATRIQQLSLAEIRDSASAVLVVDVLGSSSRAGKAKMVWTDYRMRVVEVLHGTQHPGELLTLPFAGGRLGLMEVGIGGVPTLNDGARYLIFLDDVEGRPVPAIGWMNGLFQLRAHGGITSLSGERLVVDRDGRFVVQAGGPRSPVGAGRRLGDPIVLDADGVVVAAAPQRAQRVRPADSLRDATLDDVRRFVREAQ